MEILKCDKWENKTLVGMVGLPYSGKSTIAKETSKRQGWPIVCPDAVRIAIHGPRVIALTEPIVWAIVKIMVYALFLAGHNAVILDATNLTQERRDQWKSTKYELKWMYVNTSADVCKQRAIENNDVDILLIIEGMAMKMEVDEFRDRA